jgi:syringate O-demethylase
MEFPSAVYAMHPFDRVEKDGQLVGLSTWVGYSANEGKILTLAMVDESVATPGTEVEFVWGEPHGGTTKPTVEPHKQVVIKAVVAAVPYSEVARTSYADSWRTKATL